MRLCYSCMQQVKDEKLNTCPNCGESLNIQAQSSQYLQPGTVLQGKFIVGKPLGAGGFGNTYIGWNQVLLCKVAIKEYYPGQFINRSEDGVTVTVTDQTMKPRFRAGLQQFLEEARSVANLQDVKGVVSIYNFFEENGTGYIVMEYLEGMDVKTILKKSGNRQSYEWSRRVILTVLHTLREIHKRGVLHRDIAPDNIFVTNEGVIKLIDFGAAKHSSELANMRSDIILKVGYAPIEQYSKTAKQGPYTDLYAVAALFYRMLTGFKPSPANERITEDRLKPPSELGVVLPEQAEMAIMVCLNVQPEYRLQSAEEFMEALDGKYFVPVFEPEWILPPDETEKRGILAKISTLNTGIKAAVMLLALCLLGGGVAGIYALTHQKRAVESVSVDDGQILTRDCVGKSLSEATQILKNQGFVVGEPVEYQYNENVPEEEVMEQSIGAGTKVAKGETVSLVVSGGKNKFTMPDFSTCSQEESKEFLDSKHVSYELKEVYSQEIEKGHLVTQTIPPQSLYNMAANSEKLILMYSVGPKSEYEKKMPDLSGLTEKEAKKKLKKVGITINVVTQTDTEYSNVPKNRVVSHSPQTGETINVREADKVTLVLSKGKKTVNKTVNKTESSTREKRKAMMDNFSY